MELISKQHVRSLFSGETLVDDLRVAVDSKVVDGVVICRGVSPTLRGSDPAQGRERVTSKSLHCCEGYGCR